MVFPSGDQHTTSPKACLAEGVEGSSWGWEFEDYSATATPRFWLSSDWCKSLSWFLLQPFTPHSFALLQSFPWWLLAKQLQHRFFSLAIFHRSSTLIAMYLSQFLTAWPPRQISHFCFTIRKFRFDRFLSSSPGFPLAPWRSSTVSAAFTWYSDSPVIQSGIVSMDSAPPVKSGQHGFRNLFQNNSEKKASRLQFSPSAMFTESKDCAYEGIGKFLGLLYVSFLNWLNSLHFLEIILKLSSFAPSCT